MPPSGFKQDAINGLLRFVQNCYERVLSTYESGTDERVQLQHEMGMLEQFASTAGALGVSREGIEGLADFMRYNFRDLIAEIDTGVKPNGEALRRELDDIKSYLARFSIH